MLIVIILCIAIVILSYLLYVKMNTKTQASPDWKKKELPPAVSFLLDEVNYDPNAKEQLDIILKYTYIFDDDLIGLKLQE